MNESNENFYLTNTPIKKLLVKFSIPCVLAMLVNALYNIVDQIFIGNSAAGTAGIMATTLVFPFTVITLALALLIGDGAATLFSISLGAKDEKTSNKCVGNAIITVIVCSIILLLIGFVLMTPILSLFGLNGYSLDCQNYTKQYYTIILCGTPFFMFGGAMASIIRASGAPGYSMISSIAGAIVNLIFDPILIFACNMGIKGAAIATIAGQILTAILCGIYFIKPKLIKFSKDSFKMDFSVLGRFLRLGISSFITQISICVTTVVSNNVIGTIGGANATDAGGALGIVFKIFGIIIAFCIGVSVGGQPIIGFNYGAKKYKRVLEAYKDILIVNIIIGVIAMILFEAIPEFFVNIFGGHADDIEFYRNYACLSFRIYLGGILFCCIQKASCIYLQSINKPYKSMILSLMRDILLLVPGVTILGLTGGLYKMLWAGPIADVGAFIATVIFVSVESKKIAKLAEQEESEQSEQDTKVVAKPVSSIKEKFVISIGREFGSGGKYIGEELAKRFNIKCYDDELLSKVSTDYNIDMDMIEKADEKQKSSFWYGFATNYVFSDNQVEPISADDNLFLKQAKVIEDLYNDKNSSIIIGRCSDYILKDRTNVIKIFIYSSNMDFKIDRKAKYEKLNKTIAEKKIKQIDKERADYYNHFTSQEWGNRDNYDICIDTSKIGVDKTIDILENYVKTRIA